MNDGKQVQAKRPNDRLSAVEWPKQAGMSEEAEHLRKRYRFRERRRTDRSYVAESKLENLTRRTRSWLVNDGKQLQACARHAR